MKSSKMKLLYIILAEFSVLLLIFDAPLLSFDPLSANFTKWSNTPMASSLKENRSKI